MAGANPSGQCRYHFFCTAWWNIRKRYLDLGRQNGMHLIFWSMVCLTSPAVSSYIFWQSSWARLGQLRFCRTCRRSLFCSFPVWWKKDFRKGRKSQHRSCDDWNVLDYDAWQSFIWINLSRGIACAFTAMIYNVEPRKLLMQFPVTILKGWAFLMGGLFFSLVFHIWTISYTPTWMGYLGIAFVVLVDNALAFTFLIN